MNPTIRYCISITDNQSTSNHAVTDAGLFFLVYQTPEDMQSADCQVQDQDKHIIKTTDLKNKNAMFSLQTSKASCRWQTRATLVKSLHGLCKSGGVVSCIASLLIDSLHMVSYYRPIVTVSKCTVFETWRHIGRKLPKKPTPPSFGTFLWGDPLRTFFDDSYLARN